jgi:hypothetical protein
MMLDSLYPNNLEAMRSQLMLTQSQMKTKQHAALCAVGRS